MKEIWLREKASGFEVSLNRKALTVVGFAHETTILGQHLARRRMVHRTMRLG